MDAMNSGDNGSPAPAPKPRRRPRSFALKLTFGQSLRMLKLLLVTDLLVMAAFGLLYFMGLDSKADSLAAMTSQEAQQSARLQEGLTISYETESGYGYILHRQMRRLGFATDHVRIVNLEPTNRPILWGWYTKPVYTVSVPRGPDDYLRASFDLTDPINRGWNVLLIVLVVEFFIWTSNITAVRRSVRRTLAPIQQLAVATQHISSVPVGRMEGNPAQTWTKDNLEKYVQPGKEKRGKKHSPDPALGKYVVPGKVKGRKARKRKYNPAPGAYHPPSRYRQPEELKLSGTIDTLNKITAKHLDARIPIEHEREELRGLASAVNSMLDRLDTAYSSQLRFVSDASHELRTPIAVLQGYANMLDRWGKEDPAVLQESIEAIKAEAEGMKILVEQLLFLARGDNNSIAMKVHTLDVCDFASDVTRETQLIDQGHEFVSDFPGGALWVQGDVALLKQALRVFVDNAVKYSPEGGVIKISAKADEDWTRVSVTDNGIGIPAEDLPHVFERFYRSDESRARATGGTGLGLSIAKWIAERHGGFLEIVSREEIGTRLTMVLPSAEEPADEEEDTDDAV